MVVGGGGGMGDVRYYDVRFVCFPGFSLPE
jgi:hypothetical protein